MNIKKKEILKVLFSKKLLTFQWLWSFLIALSSQSIAQMENRMTTVVYYYFSFYSFFLLLFLFYYYNYIFSAFKLRFQQYYCYCYCCCICRCCCCRFGMLLWDHFKYTSFHIYFMINKIYNLPYKLYLHVHLLHAYNNVHKTQELKCSGSGNQPTPSSK